MKAKIILGLYVAVLVGLLCCMMFLPSNMQYIDKQDSWFCPGTNDPCYETVRYTLNEDGFISLWAIFILFFFIGGAATLTYIDSQIKKCDKELSKLK